MTTSELIETLRHGGLRVRTGLWLLPAGQLNTLPDKAARLGIDLSDARQPLLDSVAPDQRFLRLDVATIIEVLDSLCDNNQLSDCLLVTNFDLLLAKLPYSQRKEVWEILYRGYPYRPRAIILAMPEGATALLPGVQQLEQWRKEGRLVP